MLKAEINLLFLLLFQVCLAQTHPLFRITEQNKVGFIDASGKVVIPPVYLNGSDFSEGLAAVRPNGLYGYINETGTFIIKPQFDFATSFIKGLAVVYKKGKPYFIDKTGEIYLPPVYRTLTFINNEQGIIETLSDRQGLIDIKSKKLIIDTIYGSIGDFSNGVAIVESYLSTGHNRRDRQVGVIDSLGRTIVPFGKYESIKPFYGGYAVVEIKAGKKADGDIDGVIDTKGNLLFKRPLKNSSWVDGDFHNGFAKMSLYKYWIPEEKNIDYSSDKSYEGYINLKGEIVFNDTNYRYVNDFSDGRAFVTSDNEDYVMLDTNFKLVGQKRFKSVQGDCYKNGYAIVETDQGWGIIDTSGKFVVNPRYGDIDETGVIDNYFFFGVYSANDTRLIGVADLDNNILIKPVLQDFDRRGFVNGLLSAVVDGRLTYLNKSGEIVWQEKRDSSSLKKLNIDFMNRGYFYAYSSNLEHSGGWAVSPNKSQIIQNRNDFDSNELKIRIDVNEADTFEREFFGYKLYVANATNDTVKFNAQDSRLYLKLQAQNDKGVWKDIEYLPSSWCGNSYHQIQLEPNAFWSFTIPQYEGEFKTKIRAELKYIDKKNPRKELTVYSNIIDASVNPGQFWNKRVYYPQGIMDPYND